MKYLASIRFFNSKEGGRNSPPQADYHPSLKVGDEFTTCIIRPQKESVIVMEFGVIHDVSMELMFPEQYKNNISKGMKVELYEGSKLVGVGEIRGSL